MIKYLLLTVILFSACSCMHGKDSDDFSMFSECPDSPNCVSSMAKPSDKEHYIKPYEASESLTLVYEKLLRYLKSQQNVELIEKERNVYIRAVFISGFFKFKDDVEFGFREAEDGGIVIDICSRSRTGYSDLGVNRKRMEEIREKLFLD